MTRVSGDWLHNPQTQAVCEMLSSVGYQALFVGGCVRNALIDVSVNDIDIATDAAPEAVVDLAVKAGFHAIPTGIEHGTVTVISGGTPHEITTFRKDVETDGRRAVVAFSSSVEEDARRRDFTMNALYAHSNGLIVDPLCGIQDLWDRRVRFIDDANLRIREDYLRILRYFRFHAWYGDPQAGLDSEALAAIAANSAGIETLSKERLGSEMLKLLEALDPAPAVAAMRTCGVLGMVLEGADDRMLALLVHFETELGVAPDALRRLACLGGESVANSLRLSKKQAKQRNILVSEIGSMTGAVELAYRFNYEIALSIMLLRSAMFETPLSPTLLEDLTVGSKARFPVKPANLLPKFQGPALGSELKRLEIIWITTGFSLTCAELLGENH